MAPPRSLWRGVIGGGVLWTAGALLPEIAEDSGRWFAVLCVLALLLMAAGLVWIGASLRPLSLVRGRLSMLRSGADKELTGAYPAELQPLVDDLNELVSALEKINVSALSNMTDTEEAEAEADESAT